jgi:hypothetical protein
MIYLKLLIIALLALAPLAVAADPLPDMSGAWSGSGWARQTPDGPKEAVRCRLDNTYDPGARALTVSGKCVVPGRRIDMSGSIIGADGTDRITGRWANPEGAGSVRISGVQQDGLVAFTFSAAGPDGRSLAQNIEWRVTGGALRLRSTDRTDPSIMMSDLTFRR